jgi:hypothetical protein
MSAGTNTNYEARITRLEETLNWLIGYARDTNKLARDALQKALGSGLMAFGGGSSNFPLIAYTPTGGIPFATFTGTDDTISFSPGVATCWIYGINNGNVTYMNQSDVYNYYTSTTSTGVGAGKAIIVFPSESGDLIVLGEPC